MEAVQHNNTPTNMQQQQQAGAMDDTLQLRDLLDIFVQNWKWFILSSILCLAGMYVYLSSKPYIYQRQAVLLVKEDQAAGARRSSDALMQLNGMMGGSSVKNEIYILKSHQLVGDVVKMLHLDVIYTAKQRLRTISLYKQKPFEVQFMEEEKSAVRFTATLLNANEVKLANFVTADGDADYEQIVHFGELIKTPAGELTLIPNSANIENFINKKISIFHLNQEQSANRVAGQLGTSAVDKESTLVRITCTDTDITRADDILAALLEAYKKSIIEDKNQKALSTADFIDERIKLISAELNQVEGQLASFKQSNNLVDLSSSASSYLQQSSQARQRSIQLQAQLGVANYLLDYMKQNSQGNSLIPTMGGLTDTGIQSQIQKYNDMMLQRNRLAASGGETSTVVAQMDENLSQMRHTAVASMQAYLSSLELQVKQAEREEKALSGTLSAVPVKEKQVIDIARQQSIKEALYTYLLNKREETALQLAVNEANVRVVEAPFGSRAPIAPRRSTMLLAALLVGFALPFGIVYVYRMLNMSVRGRKDVETLTTIPVLGEIPLCDSDLANGQIVVQEQSNNSINEAFRMTRFNIGFMNQDARVIMFTSTTPSEGKSFISRNMAVAMQLTGKRVLLIDTDIRKRTLSSFAGATSCEGLTSYLAGSADDFQSLVVKATDKFPVDFIPAGITPPNPAELLMSKRLDQLIEEAKQVYDYVIIDNVPAQVVADAAIVNRVAELTIYVVRDGKLDRRYLPELERLHQDKVFNNLCILINGTNLKKQSYGYGYGYGYGYVKKKRS